MALDALLARLEGRAVTAVTADVTPDVTPKPATIQASAPLRCSPVTSVTSVTANNDDTAGEAIREPIPDPAMEARRRRVRDELRAASEAAAIVRREVTDPLELEVVDWLERILEPDPVVYRETMAKCRDPDGLAFFLALARGEDTRAVH